MALTDEIILRDWHPSDASTLVRILNNFHISTQLPHLLPSPYTLRHARVFIGMTNCCGNRLEKAIEQAGTIVGGISLIPQEDIWRKNAELRFFLDEIHWKSGIMSCALAKMIRYIFDNFDFERIYSPILEGNDAGVRVLEKVGFTQEGLLRKAAYKEGKSQNVSLYSILRKE
ncbi:MAG: GNAT family protein [Bacteroidales bacterium]